MGPRTSSRRPSSRRSLPVATSDWATPYSPPRKTSPRPAPFPSSSPSTTSSAIPPSGSVSESGRRDASLVHAAHEAADRLHEQGEKKRRGSGGEEHRCRRAVKSLERASGTVGSRFPLEPGRWGVKPRVPAADRGLKRPPRAPPPPPPPRSPRLP